jgi:FixJ family two-component response regulator
VPRGLVWGPELLIRETRIKLGIAPYNQEARPSVVCLIDDDVSLLRAVKRLLGASGFLVTAFSSAEEFLESRNVAAVGCLVLDVHLGGLSGFELHERLVSAGRRIPVVFITAHDDSLTRDRARRAGAVEYLPKPFSDESLIAGINRALAQV